MKYFILFFLTGCATSEYKQLSKNLTNPGFSSIEDVPNNVVCYIYKDNEDSVVVSMQCMRKDEFKGLKFKATIEKE